MHRIIMNAPQGQQVDHRALFADDKVIDNRRENLRFATHKENQQNLRKQVGCSSIFKGVTYDKACRNVNRRWAASMGAFIGRFTNEGHAAMAYDLKAVETQGEFARTNFPVPGSTNWLFG